MRAGREEGTRLRVGAIVSSATSPSREGVPMTRLRITCPASGTRSRSALVLGLLLMTAGTITTAAEPLRSAARYVPAKDVAVYLEYEGLGAHLDAWKATAAHAMLRDTPAGKMTAEI